MTLYTLVLTSLIVMTVLINAQKVDDACTLQTGSSGVCRLIKDCLPAIMEIRKTRRQHSFPRCGFDGLMEIVCCPEESSSTSSSGSRTTTESKWSDEVTTRRTTTEAVTTDDDDEVGVRGPHVRKSITECEKYKDKFKISIEYQILGGTEADDDEFPHMVAFGYSVPLRDEPVVFECGGSLISDRYVLTAAHCLTRIDGGNLTTLRMGQRDLSATSKATDKAPSKIIIHPDYNHRSKHNDIALIELESPVKFSKSIHPACLYTNSDDPDLVIVTGWGLTSIAGEQSNVLLKVRLRTVSVSECNKTYTKDPKKSNIITDAQVCANSPDNVKRDACGGDSGGPMMYQLNGFSNVYHVVGITSFGRGCGVYPGVYTRVYSYLKWIESIVWP